MKKIFAALFLAAALCGNLIASDFQEKTILTSTVLTTDQNYTTDLHYGFTADWASVQAIYSAQSYNGIYCTTNSFVLGNLIVSTSTFPTGYAVLFTSSGLTGQSLVNNATYYVIAAQAGYIQLATTKANAVAGTAVTVSTGVGSGSFVLTPVAIQSAGTGLLQVQASNDNTNFYVIDASSVVINSSSNSNYMWNLRTTYKYLRIAFTAPLQGAVNLKLYMVKRRFN